MNGPGGSRDGKAMVVKGFGQQPSLDSGIRICQTDLPSEEELVAAEDLPVHDERGLEEVFWSRSPAE
jgi:hypothetical protein